MIYPQNAIDKLGFTDIRSLIKEKCLSEAGKVMVERIQPQVKMDQIDRFLRQTQEFKNILQHDAPLPVDHIYPIKPLAEKAKVEGSFLLEEELYRMLLSLRTVYAIIRYFNEREGQYAHLELLFEHLPIEKSILRSIEMVLDERGKMKDNASRALLDLSQQIAKSEQEARKRLDTVFKQAQSNGWTADGGLTIRDGRFCIPILAENKRKLKGLIHDESATGQTAYIEPEEVFHLNNKVRDLEFERRREVIRILTALTTELRPHVPLLLAYHSLLTKLDFVRAKALFAIDIDAVMPLLSKEADVSLVNARHPLLFLNAKRDSQHPVVPLNIKIDATDRIILVSGPNAGGKSVCMKTVGLLQLMLQSGLLIPADETSTVGIFKQIFADIGDDQSIESDLSTYSAHLSKMKYFAAFANARTLVLIDEFGTGTDPQFGGPIAEAVLEQLNNKKVRGVITTHYSNLKLFASHAEGLENASMLFDNQQMKPLYILQTGKPGSSYAFEIAQKIGLPKEILQAAKQKIGVQQKKVDTLLVDLERDKKEIYDTKKAVNRREKEVEELKAKYESLQAYMEENKKEIIRTAKEEARSILKDANKLVENTISEIKSVQADKDKTKEIRSRLNQQLDKHTSDLKEKVVKPKLVDAGHVELQIGDWVRIEDSGSEGEILEITKSSSLIIALGELRTVVKKNRVTRLRSKEKSKAIKRQSNISTDSAADFQPEIDVRGMRTEDALQKIELVLDRAVMIGYPTLKIVHGKGDGILRKFVRDYLRKYSHVNRFEDEHADRGGDGITYAYIN
ncbi:endonuclease MutS2 [Sphingobacterium alkalisoli]|uniref:Endonuclease MutS2 n=1 Tax=Sphingobacterium alkalisoli TaxID=1874115 RepID=A0A4U0H2W3_9SPHI|nr:endonuclease MutS2 [Sphingobacterium alkalisoli]TJY65975.1 endonuclease MutS2 [Sphingobacterium alkalisoli]GGH17085.1 endonuclease MutS2 [Sphingobacterium alkalisoli]